MDKKKFENFINELDPFIVQYVEKRSQKEGHVSHKLEQLMGATTYVRNFCLFMLQGDKDE